MRTPAAQTAKEILVAGLQDAGYDVFTACELVTERLVSLPTGTHEIVAGDIVVTVTKV